LSCQVVVVLVADPLNDRGISENSFMINYDEDLLGKDFPDNSGRLRQHFHSNRNLVIVKMLLNRHNLEIVGKWGCEYLLASACVEEGGDGRVRGESQGGRM
jgi:hypothetical protein